MDVGVFLFLTCAVVVNFAGYIYVLAIARWLRPWKLPDARGLLGGVDLPQVTVVVCVRNEEVLIAPKIENLRRSSYPADRIRILVVDGGSTDATRDRVQVLARAPGTPIELLELARGDKILQLNAALARIPEDHVVVQTDADARTEDPDAIGLAAATLVLDPEVGAVGGWTMPPEAGSMPVERGYWDKQNRLRYMETVCFSASIVVAPFYAFRRRDFTGWPADCVADDVFLSFRMHERGARVVYSPEIRVTEERQATTFGLLARHKYRKIHAYTTEALRFVHRLPHLRKRAKMLLIFQLLQMFALPWSLVLFAAWATFFVATGHWTLVVWCAGAIVAATGVASVLMTPPPGRSRGGLHPRAVLPSLVIFSLVTCLLVLNMFLFPFWRQSATYPRCDGGD